MLTILPLIQTSEGLMELLGYCKLSNTFTVRTLDGKHIKHLQGGENELAQL